MNLNRIYVVFLSLFVFVGCDNKSELQSEIKLINKETNIKLPEYILRIGVNTESYDSDYTRNYIFKIPTSKSLEFMDNIDSMIKQTNDFGFWEKKGEFYFFTSKRKQKKHHYFEMEYSIKTNILTVTERLF